MEEWKDIPGWEGLYQAHPSGKIRSLDREVPAKAGATALRKGRVLSPVGKRRAKVTLADGDRRQQFQVGRLVAWTFLGPQPEGRLVCHKDDDSYNNDLKNLYYGTPKENWADSRPNRDLKLNPAKVREIRKLRAETDLTLPEIGEMFGVSPGHVAGVANGRGWTHVT